MYLIIILVLLLVIVLYSFGTKGFDYWEKRGVKYDKPIPFFGNCFWRFLQKISTADMYADIYRRYPEEKIVGAFRAGTKVAVLRDPELVKRVLVTDFQYFYPRGVNPHKKVIEPMMKNLFFADGDLWKLLRQRMTPAFSTGKLKAMFPLIVERAEKLRSIAKTAAENDKEIDVRDLMARYTTDFIGACGFGIDTDALSHENSTFRELGRRIFKVTLRDAVVLLLKFTAPNMFKHLHFLRPEIEDNAVSLVTKIMNERNHKPSGRNDFIDLLLELQEKGVIVGESIEKTNSDGAPEMTELELDDLLMTAQVLVFFVAGFETSSSATSFTLHQLAFHPEIQKRCQEDIDEVLNKYDNKLCYDAVKEMKYLEMAFKEGLRMYPSLGFLIRKCVKKYKFPDTNVTIDEGVVVIVPTAALQNDPVYFEEPHEFKPERFSPDNIENIEKHVYLPFGEGPRACIGERLGLMQSLAGLAALLSQYTVVPSDNTIRHPITDPSSSIVQIVKGGLPLKLISRKKVQ